MIAICKFERISYRKVILGYENVFGKRHI